MKTEKIYRVAVMPRAPDFDPHGRSVLAEAGDLGIRSIRGIHSCAVTFLQGDLDPGWVNRIARDLLCDPVTQHFSVHEGMDEVDDQGPAIEVHFLPGVMDPVAMSTLAAVREMLETLQEGAGRQLFDVRTARRYIVEGHPSLDELQTFAFQALANDCIEAVYLRADGRGDPLPRSFPIAPTTPFLLRHVPLVELDDHGLDALSRELHLFLSTEEMRAVCEHFKSLGRDPTDLELETLAQTWSEHCVHKTLKSSVVYRGSPMVQGAAPQEVEIRYENLLRDTIAKATRTLNKDWCLSVFEDNAGVIAFDDDYGVAVKVETHNHPSAIEPYGGASTGVGGCIRDIMGCGLGAKPIASTDVFCLATPTFDQTRLPQGVLHPKRVLKGVVAGVRDYGNRMGIPTVNGAIYFDDRFLANPLVFCGCVGLIPRNRLRKGAKKDDWVVVAGGRTGRDGIHGATFSSTGLTTTHADEFSHAVQIGNAIVEKRLLDALLAARDHATGCLFSAVTDCGAGGLSSAVGEMAAKTGVTVDLEKVPLKYAGLRYDEIWISEAQERMVFSVPSDRLNDFLAMFAAEETEATVIGRFTGDGMLRVRYHGTLVGELNMKFLHQGLPKQTRIAEWRRPNDPIVPVGAGRRPPNDSITPNAKRLDLHPRLLSELAAPNVASKEFAFRTYDHEVQGGSCIKPLCGQGQGPADAAVIRPRLDSRRAVAIGCGLCPSFTEIDPYSMAVAAVDEALRNVICVGGDPERTAILDNFCWGSCSDPQAMGELVRACQGCHDVAVAYGLPFISGKDSLNNEFTQSAEESHRTGLPERLCIPGTLLISAISVMNDLSRCVTMDLKQPGHRLLGVHCSVLDHGLAAAARFHRRVADWIRSGCVAAAHDVSDGGLGVALAEMAIAGRLGVRIQLDKTVTVDDLFDPWVGAYVLECRPDIPTRDLGSSVRSLWLGEVTDSPVFEILMQEERTRWNLQELDLAWRGFGASPSPAWSPRP